MHVTQPMAFALLIHSLNSPYVAATLVTSWILMERRAKTAMNATTHKPALMSTESVSILKAVSTANVNLATNPVAADSVSENRAGPVKKLK